MFKNIKILYSINTACPSNFQSLNIFFFQKLHYYYTKLLKNLNFLINVANKFKTIQITNITFDVNYLHVIIFQILICFFFAILEILY